MPGGLVKAMNLVQSRESEDVDMSAMRLDAMLETGEFTLEATSCPDEVREAWLALQGGGHCTLFTSYEWLSSWYRFVARARGIEALIVVGRIDDEPIFLLPLMITRRAGGLLTVGRFLGDCHGNQNSGLWRCDVLAGINGPSVREALIALGRERGIDLFDLKYIPATLVERAHPLVGACATESLNCVHTFPITGDFDTVYRTRRSASARKKLRTKERKLAQEGQVDFVQARDAETAHRFLDALIAQRSAREATQGIPNVFRSDDLQAFLRDQLDTALAAGSERMMIYALTVDGRICATYLCGLRFGRFHAYTNSIDEAFATFSPGDLLLSRVIEDACVRGAEVFDFGLGAERYKTAWAEKETLMDVEIPVSLLGLGARTGVQRIRRTKRTIRNSPVLWSLVRRLRRLTAPAA